MVERSSLPENTEIIPCRGTNRDFHRTTRRKQQQVNPTSSSVDESARFQSVEAGDSFGYPRFLENVILSAWKSGLKTGKKPDQDRNRTNQDRKFPGPEKTKTAVRSSVLQDPGYLRTGKNRLRPVLTGLHSTKG
jgi:hypothetical protein